jgi:DNA polymerase III sliding clamp (beta) subunit (PCNA family)
MVQDKTDNRVVLAFEPGSVSVSSFASEVGEYESALAIEFDGPLIRIAFNSVYLVDIIKAAGGETVYLKANKPATPVVFESGDRPNDIALIMPIKLADYDMSEEVAA